MPKYLEEAIVDKLSRSACKIGDLADNIEFHLESAIVDFKEIGISPHPGEAKTATGMIADATIACESEAELIDAIGKFDAELAKLIHLRTQLADVSGIPMYSHMTGGRWARLERLDM
jgi:hypothetical protein